MHRHGHYRWRGEAEFILFQILSQIHFSDALPGRLDLCVLLFYFNSLCITVYSSKGARTIPWGKDSLSTNDVGKLDSHTQENEARPLSHTVCEVNSKWIKDFSVGAKTVKLLKEEVETFVTLESAVILWIWYQRRRQRKKKIDKSDFTKIKIFRASKGAINIKKGPMEWEKCLQIIDLIKAYSRMCRELLQLNNNKNPNNSVKK